MEIDEMKTMLPLPQLMGRLGYGEEYQKRSCRSPFREEKKPSFGIFKHEGKWFYRDFGANLSGDEISFLKDLKGLDDKQAIDLYKDLVGAKE